MVNVPFSKGERLIVVHAGSVSGFFSGAKLIFKANTSTGNYHGEMNGDIFTKLLNDKLTPLSSTQCHDDRLHTLSYVLR
jgi:hypothetical protein